LGGGGGGGGGGGDVPLNRDSLLQYIYQNRREGVYVCVLSACVCVCLCSCLYSCVCVGKLTATLFMWADDEENWCTDCDPTCFFGYGENDDELSPFFLKNRGNGGVMLHVATVFGCMYTYI